MAISLRALSVAGAACVLTACATTPPPAVSGTPSTDTPTPAASDSPAPSPTEPAGTPSASTSTAPATASPQPSTSLVFQGKGLDGAAFGTPEGTVTALLTARAGKPDNSYSGPVCELDDATPYGRQLTYDGVALMFQSKAKGTKSSPRTFTSWVISLDQPLGKSMKLTDGYPMEKTSFAALKTTFPKGKLSAVNLGESQVYVFRTPSGIWYRGDGKKTPNAVGAGPMGVCE